MQEPNSTDAARECPASRRDSRWTVPGFSLVDCGAVVLGHGVELLRPASAVGVGADGDSRAGHGQLAVLANVVAAFVLSYSIMFAVGGRFLDRVGTRRGMLICVSVWTVASAAHAWARSAWQLGMRAVSCWASAKAAVFRA